MTVLIGLTVSYVLAVSATIPAERDANWSGDYSPCDRHSELLEKRRVELGVRFSTSNPQLAAEFARAMDYWATVLDMEWREDNSRTCAIQIVDGRPDLFTQDQLARAQLPDRSGFQGWIAFNPKINLPPDEMFFVAVHELGHLLGLPHNSSASSVMFYLQVDEPLVLNKADLWELAAHHKLRINSLDWPLPVTAPALSAVTETAGHGDGENAGRPDLGSSAFVASSDWVAEYTNRIMSTDGLASSTMITDGAAAVYTGRHTTPTGSSSFSLASPARVPNLTTIDLRRSRKANESSRRETVQPAIRDKQSVYGGASNRR